VSRVDEKRADLDVDAQHQHDPQLQIVSELGKVAAPKALSGSGSMAKVWAPASSLTGQRSNAWRLHG